MTLQSGTMRLFRTFMQLYNYISQEMRLKLILKCYWITFVDATLKWAVMDWAVLVLGRDGFRLP